MTEPELPFVPHSTTSRAAAVTARPGAARQRQAVLDWLAVHGPATDEQMQEGLGMDPNSQRPRRVELAAARVIEKAGEGRTRKGRRAVTWRACTN